MKFRMPVGRLLSSHNMDNNPEGSLCLPSEAAQQRVSLWGWYLEYASFRPHLVLFPLLTDSSDTYSQFFSQACLDLNVKHQLQAAGTKGKRLSLPNSRIMIHQPVGQFRHQAQWSSDGYLSTNKCSVLWDLLCSACHSCCSQALGGHQS